MKGKIPIVPLQETEEAYTLVLKDKLTDKPYEYAHFRTEKQAIDAMVYFLKKGQFAIVTKKT